MCIRDRPEFDPFAYQQDHYVYEYILLFIFLFLNCSVCLKFSELESSMSEVSLIDSTNEKTPLIKKQNVIYYIY